MADTAALPLVLGTSHVVAEEGVRERLHLPADVVVSVARGLVARGFLSEALPLSTCGRLELYGRGPAPERAAQVLRRLMSQGKGLPRHVVRTHTYHHQGAGAVRHAFRVAAGLDSVVHGEAQILGQIRDALAQARGEGLTGPLTERLFQRALATGKRVRSETDIGRGNASLASAALRLVRHDAGPLDGRSALVIGAGQTGSLVARLLRKHGVTSLVVANRTDARARALAEALGGRGVSLDRLPEELPKADIIIGAVAGSHGVLGPGDVAGLRDGRVRYLVDLSHPRAFDPGLATHEGIHLVDLDRISREVEQARSRRNAQVPAAEAIVDDEVGRFEEWLRRRHAVPILRGLREQVLARAQEEAERLARGGSPQDVQQARRLARAVARSLLHRPTVALRDVDPSSPDGRVLLDAAASLFGVGSTLSDPS
ncbi:MAG: glutamyl-tRNA reductase [Longimicrobiales bacterium]